jgi:hydrogenase small subunit
MNASGSERHIRGRAISRRDFLKFCTFMAGTLALNLSDGSKIARALSAPKRTPVVWLEMQDCAGCTEALLRASNPTVSELVLDVLSVDYHETIMAAAGKQAEKSRQDAIKTGGYLLVVEGSIPKGENGAYCTIGGRTALDLLDEAAKNAIAIVAVGNCASFGGWPKAGVNPTDAYAVDEMIKDKPILNLPGCPYNPVNLTATVVHFLTFGALPDVDSLKRPLFAYGARIHDNCERRGHFDRAEFVEAWGDDGAKKGWCLYKMGCKGPVTFHNCPAVRYNEGTSWPVKAGHGCVGCSEPGFWDLGVYTTAKIQEFAPPSAYAPVQPPTRSIDPASAAFIGGAAGIAVGAAAAAAYMQLSKPDEREESKSADSGKE